MRGGVPVLSDYFALEAYQQANQHIFPSPNSLRWFYRQHRSELIESGAVVRLAGRLMVHGGNMERIVKVIGARAALQEQPGVEVD